VTHVSCCEDVTGARHERRTRASDERNGITGDFRGSEFAGATFSPDGEWLFFNIQTPVITIAVTGPWGRGML